MDCNFVHYLVGTVKEDVESNIVHTILIKRDNYQDYVNHKTINSYDHSISEIKFTQFPY